MYFGISRVFDLGITTGITYCGKVCGLRQDVGLDVHVPLRWTLFHSGIVAGGLKFAPYFMIGQGNPSISIGGDFAFLIDIAVPKIFKVIIGPELRTGFASTGNGNNRSNFYDGAMVLNFGLETVLARQWFLGLMFRAGGNWAAGDRSGGGGIFNALIYFAYKF
jgi:hypothetical protein